MQKFKVKLNFVVGSLYSHQIQGTEFVRDTATYKLFFPPSIVFIHGRRGCIPRSIFTVTRGDRFWKRFVGHVAEARAKLFIRRRCQQIILQRDSLRNGVSARIAEDTHDEVEIRGTTGHAAGARIVY